MSAPPPAREIIYATTPAPKPGVPQTVTPHTAQVLAPSGLDIDLVNQAARAHLFLTDAIFIALIGFSLIKLFDYHEARKRLPPPLPENFQTRSTDL